MGKHLVWLAAFLWCVGASHAAETAKLQPSGKIPLSISGRVTGESGRPLSGLRAEVFTCADETPSGAATTNAAGDYVIDGLDKGCYIIRFDGDGYESTWLGEPAMRESATEIYVDDRKVEGIDGSVSEAGSAIAGKVLRSDGKPLSGAWVTAIHRDEIGLSVSDAQTDEKGSYSIRVSPGRYFIVFARRGYVSQMYGKSIHEPLPVEAAEGKIAKVVDVKLSKGGSISGKVVDESGHPVQGVYAMSLAVGTAALPATSRTNRQGEFVLDGLATGKYRIALADRENRFQFQFHDGKINPEEASLVAVTAPAATTGIKAILQTSGAISGRVTDASGNAVPNAMVVVERLDGNGLGGNAVTDESGQYTVRGLGTGTYRVNFVTFGTSHLSQYYRDVTEESAAVPVEVVAPQVVSGIDQALPEGTLVTGTVTSAAGGPIPHVMITAYHAGNENMHVAGFGFTSPEGTYSMALPEGEFVISYHAYPGYIEKWSGGGSTRTEATPVVISKAGGTKKLDVVMETGGSISGRIKNRAGNGVGRVTVSALDIGTGDQVASGTSDEGGKYSVTGLPAGLFRLVADGTDVGYIRQTFLDPVNVTPPAVTENMDLIITAGGAITGKVTDGNGSGVKGVAVGAYDPENWDEAGAATTDESGVYKISGLPEKKYRIRFEKDESKYAVQWFRGKTRREESADVGVSGTATVGGIDAVLVAGVPLTGNVSDAAGAPLADATVEVYGGLEDEPYSKVKTDKNGKYNVTALAPGSYRIRFNHDEHVPKWHGGQDRRTATPVAVREQGTTPVSVVLVKAGGKLSGKLLNPEGQKVGKAWVTAMDANGVAVADERICECSGQFNTYVPAGVYQLKVERHGLVTWYGGKNREEALQLPVNGEVSGLHMVIEDKIVRKKETPPVK